MERKITVKGIGHVTAIPDYVIIYISIDATNKKYDKAVEETAERINRLSNALVEAGFENDSLKTVDFKVRTETSYRKNMKAVIEGFTCANRMKLAFDFDGKKLSKAIDAITNCVSEPRLNITFTVKDEEAIKDELLKSAGTNARRRAEILCEAAGGKLGNLITVDYNWKSFNIFSPTKFDNNRTAVLDPMADDCCLLAAPMMAPKTIQPDNIDLNDDAIFVWEII